MAAMSDYLEAQLLNLILRTQTAWKPSGVYIALCTAATSDTQTGATITEVPNSGSYARKQVTQLDANWNTPSTGVGGALTDNVAEIAFTTATGNWGTVSHIAICDSGTWGAGNVLLHGALTASKTVNSGDTFRFSAGDLDITFA